MIALAADCLVFEMTGGESVPFSADMISQELVGGTPQLFDAELVQHATNAVFHYFKHDLGRSTVTLGEFASLLEKVLRGFTARQAPPAAPPEPPVLESDLSRLASESGAGCELFFFPRLRAELRSQLRQAPRLLRFRGLRPCVMQLAHARRWTPRCRNLEEQIVAYLRGCLSVEAGATDLALVVQ